MNVLIVGSGGREHAIARTLAVSQKEPRIFCFGKWKNPGISELASDYALGEPTEALAVAEYAKKQSIDFAVIGPEAPLAAGVVDELAKSDIPAVGPEKELAAVETSKSFCRQLLAEYNIEASPKHKYFSSLEGLEEYFNELKGSYAIKADGLMGGKGVKLSGDHLKDDEEALEWAKEILKKEMGFLVEEKLSGPEFSLMSFSDGENSAHMPAVQDYKRLLEGDQGPQTGGMGSYSMPDHKLPFLTDKDIARAQEINQKTITALRSKFKKGYKGILYGGFMKTKEGVRLLEYNARLGDPEGINALALLESDFVDICQAIIKGTLSQEQVVFKNKATVLKYAVPEGHPENPVKDAVINLSEPYDKSKFYLAGVDEKEGKWYCTGSRAIASLGVADSIEEAEKIAEEEIQKVKGPLYHRSDIGKVW